jgi:hypothetical protein
MSRPHLIRKKALEGLEQVSWKFAHNDQWRWKEIVHQQIPSAIPVWQRERTSSDLYPCRLANAMCCAVANVAEGCSRSDVPIQFDSTSSECPTLLKGTLYNDNRQQKAPLHKAYHPNMKLLTTLHLQKWNCWQPYTSLCVFPMAEAFISTNMTML